MPKLNFLHPHLPPALRTNVAAREDGSNKQGSGSNLVLMLTQLHPLPRDWVDNVCPLLWRLALDVKPFNRLMCHTIRVMGRRQSNMLLIPGLAIKVN